MRATVAWSSLSGSRHSNRVVLTLAIAGANNKNNP